MIVSTQKGRRSAKDKLLADLERLFAITGDARFAEAAKAVQDHASAFPRPGRKPIPPERLNELDAMAERAFTIATGGVSLPKAVGQAVMERCGPARNKVERNKEINAVIRHYHESWRPRHDKQAGELGELRELLS